MAWCCTDSSLGRWSHCSRCHKLRALLTAPCRCPDASAPANRHTEYRLRTSASSCAVARSHPREVHAMTATRTASTIASFHGNHMAPTLPPLTSPPDMESPQSKPRVVLVHGAHDSARSFDPVLDLLPELDVTTYTRRGWGPDENLAPITLATHIDDLLDVLDEQPSTVVGHSWGGNV